MSEEPFKSDGCTLFPNLWFKHCCKDHDYAHWAGHPQHQGDVNFLACIALSSHFLGPLSFLFAGLIVSGMATGRPVYRLYQKLTKPFFSGKNKL